VASWFFSGQTQASWFAIAAPAVLALGVYFARRLRAQVLREVTS
jgi:hypothetical protein